MGRVIKVEKLDGDVGIFRGYLRIHVEVDIDATFVAIFWFEDDEGLDSLPAIKYK